MRTNVELIQAGIETFADQALSEKSIKQCKTLCKINIFHIRKKMKLASNEPPALTLYEYVYVYVCVYVYMWISACVYVYVYIFVCICTMDDHFGGTFMWFSLYAIPWLSCEIFVEVTMFQVLKCV